MKTLKIGIAGLGNAGEAVLACLPAHPEIQLGGVADLRPAALAAFREKYPDVPAYASVDKLCSAPSVDAVWVATPHEWHARHVISAAREGKHIICEKPMALTLEECDAMIEAAAGRVRLLLHSKVQDPPIRMMRRIIAGGRLGRPVQIASWNYKNWILRPRLEVEINPARGGGVVYNQAPHHADIVRLVGGGLVKSVRARAGKWHPSFDCEVGYTAFLEFQEGTPAVMSLNGFGYFNVTELTWNIGETGVRSNAAPAAGLIRFDRAASETERYQDLRHRKGDRTAAHKRHQPFFGFTVVSCEKGDIRQSPDGLWLYTSEGRDAVPCPPFHDRAAPLLELKEALTHNRPSFPDGEWGKASLETVLAILESSRTGREVSLRHQVAAPEEREAFVDSAGPGSPA
jgi:phthalate 4,5-cis-dihydrodiol dehydrogenase